MDDFNEDDFGFDNSQRLYENKGDAIDDDMPALNTSGRLRLRGDLEIDGVEYSGKKVSRSSLFSEDFKNDPNEKTFYDFGQSDFDELNFLDDENSNQNNSEAKSKIKNLFYGNEQIEELDIEYEKIKNEEEELIKSMKPKLENEEKKSISVFNQKLLWDRSIELRICLQKPLSTISKLPQPEKLIELCKNNENYSKKLKLFSHSAHSTLQSFVDLIETLLNENPYIEKENEVKINENGKRARENNGDDDGDGKTNMINLDEEWKKIDDVYQRFSKLRDHSLNKWQRKTTLNYSLNSNKNKLKALNQSISEQVNNIMKNSEKVIQRTQKKFAMNENKKGEEKNVNDDGDDDEEIYNDIDFYQQILKEFIESTDTNIMGGLSSYEMSRLRNSKKKNVDRKASKGRKIRYIVHPAIVNFMAPITNEVNAMSERLTSSIFGQKPIPLKI